ncbi:serine/threonine-protein kinase [Nocardia sp. NPDC019395]|uniref:serine/threonine-protein kinase n=1 Tax=Nocardia sp. NPDC019395 TaxID=3154686 RepID=UPI0033ED5C47
MLGVGETFAGYRIEGLLGQGGMGTVYLAQHPRLPRTVALKLLNREVSTDPELARRFEREADVIARLEHPGIVGVLDRGAHDGHLWIAMQYIRGTDAASWDAARQPPATVADFLRGTAVALDYAHSRGILHRDVKPANIVIAHGDDFREAHAVLTDFGIAGLTDTLNTKLTATGTFTATLAYASPEQLSGEVVDHRSDQYSLACTLFTLLAGQPPYAATNPGQVVLGHVSKPVPRITAIRPDLPVALDAVLARAMAKQRDDRFPTCAAFTTAVLDALGGRHVENTVDIARIAPTVHNSRPAGYERPMVAAPPVPPPAPGNPIGRGASTEDRNLGIVWGVALAIFVILVLISGAAALLLPDSNEENSHSVAASEVHQYTGDGISLLVPDRDEQGWNQAI